MRLAQICPRFHPYMGGVETHVYEIARRLAKEFDVEVLTTDPSGKLQKREKMDGFIVRRFKSFAPNEAYYFSLSLYRYLKRHISNYDIIHAHNYHALPALLAALAKDENKFVFTPHYHGKGHSLIRNLLHMPYRVLGDGIFKKADAVICVSNYEKELILRNFRVNEYKIHVVPNGVNPEEFERVDEIKKCKEEVKTILYVGRIEKYKGLDFVVRALKLLPENFVLEIVGRGGYKPKIVKLARNLGVIDRISFYQDLSRADLIKKYAEADVLVLLSKFEAYGIVVAEALAAKTPCIVANTSALSEWVDNKSVFGIDYPINVEGLVKLIEKTVNVKVKGVKLPDWNWVAEKLKYIYESI